MTEIDYPPTTEWRLDAALDQVTQQIAELDADIDAADDPSELRGQRQSRASQRDALRWAIGEFGDDATIELQAYTAGRRARVIDTLNQRTMGAVGAERTRVWLLAGGIERAPWLDGGEDIRTRADLVQELPPALVDWLNEQLDDLGDLSEGN